jgi:hypothetical protein
MANCCTSDITFIRDEKPFNEDDIASLTLALEEIDHCGSGSFGFQDELIMEWSGDTRWSLPETELQLMAKSAHAKVRAIGRDDGMGFIQMLCIDEDGVTIQDQAIESAF